MYLHFMRENVVNCRQANHPRIKVNYLEVRHANFFGHICYLSDQMPQQTDDFSFIQAIYLQCVCVCVCVRSHNSLSE